MAYSDEKFLSISRQNGICHMRRPAPTAASHPAIVAVDIDSRCRIAQLAAHSRVVQLRTLRVPIGICICNKVECTSADTCQRQGYDKPIITSTLCRTRDNDQWTRLVSIAFDAEDRLYVLDLDQLHVLDPDTNRLVDPSHRGSIASCLSDMAV
jgi:hypothetical protein